MDKKYKAIWEKAKPLLEKGRMKNFVIHIKMVVRAMEEIIAGEGGDPNTLIPAAILHDVGWSELSLDLQLTEDKSKAHEALVQHIKKAPPIVRRILGELQYGKEQIKTDH